jgi:DNA-binding transcriptional ArsR family regulator
MFEDDYTGKMFIFLGKTDLLVIILDIGVMWSNIIFNIMNIINESTKTTSLEIQTQFFKVLAHPARISIINILRDGEHCVCHMEVYLGLRQAFISQQLAVLREAGIIVDRRDGWNIFYRVTNPQIYDLLDAATRLTGVVIDETMNLNVKCNCPHCNPNGNT